MVLIVGMMLRCIMITYSVGVIGSKEIKFNIVVEGVLGLFFSVVGFCD